MSDLDQLLSLLKAHREIGVLSAMPLKSTHRAVVAGAYKGDTIAFLRGMYDMNVYGYEPQEWAYNECRIRFTADFKVRLYNSALGTQEGEFRMYETGTDAATFVEREDARTHSWGKMHDVSRNSVFHSLVDVFVLNVEGYEYELIPYMSSRGLLRNVKRLVLQVHDLGKEEALVEVLYKTHRPVWAHANWSMWEVPA